MLDILNRITKGQGEPDDIEMLACLAEDVRAGSLCNLGKTAPNPVLTTLRYFPDEYNVHINEKRCPALMCLELIAFYILPDKCERSCDACIGTCTVEAIFPNKRRIKVVDQEKCVKCGTCLTSCPPQYNAIIKMSPPDTVPATEKRE
jgi:NADH-quinone oxidoreductase subunit F